MIVYKYNDNKMNMKQILLQICTLTSLSFSTKLYKISHVWDADTEKKVEITPTSSSFHSKRRDEIPILPLTLAVIESTSPESVISKSISTTLLWSTKGFRSSDKLTEDIGNILLVFSLSELF